MKFSKKDNQKGFTLIEIMVVMVILGALSTLAVNGYSTYRRTALLDLSVDSLVAQINELRDRTIHGDFGGEKFEEIRLALQEGEDIEERVGAGEAKCLGLYFGKIDDVFEVNSFDQNFNAKQVYDSFTRTWNYEGCGGFDAIAMSEFFRPLELDGSVRILEIERGRLESMSPVGDELILRFIPPSGELEIASLGFSLGSPARENDFLTITMQYGEGDDPNYKRKLIYDLVSGTSTIKRVL